MEFQETQIFNCKDLEFTLTAECSLAIAKVLQLNQYTLQEFKPVVEWCILAGSFQKPDHLATQLLRWWWSFGLSVQNYWFNTLHFFIR